MVAPKCNREQSSSLLRQPEARSERFPVASALMRIPSLRSLIPLKVFYLDTSLIFNTIAKATVGGRQSQRTRGHFLEDCIGKDACIYTADSFDLEKTNRQLTDHPTEMP